MSSASTSEPVVSLVIADFLMFNPLQLKGHLEVSTISDDSSGPTVVDDEFQFGDGKPVVEIIEHHSRRGNTDPTLQMPKAVLAD
jgi:hypothetical protein